MKQEIFRGLMITSIKERKRQNNTIRQKQQALLTTETQYLSIL